MSTDWKAWHDEYRDPGSPLSRRRAVLQRFIREALAAEAAASPRVLSLCAGDGHDLLEVLAEDRPRRTVRARLIETEPELVARARAFAEQNSVEGIEAVCGDAALTDTYAELAPAEIVLVAGVFGNISDDDVRQTVHAMPQLCRQGGIVIWTRHRRDPDLTPAIRAWFAEAGFVERHFESEGPNSFSVGMHQSLVAAQPLQRGRRLFAFVR